MRILFVTNGHGEAAIARRIAAETRALADAHTDHLALVGEGFGDPEFRDVGPQRAMPSGGLVAMANLAAFARDVAAGWISLWLAQRRFLRRECGAYDVVVAVGDLYGFVMARAARRPTIYVGTAKSVAVAPYGPFERWQLRAAALVFVRDEATAAALRAGGVGALAPGNVIVDLAGGGMPFPWSEPVRLALLPGSREPAYGDALRLGDIVVRVAELAGTDVEAALSLAPGIDAERMQLRFAQAEYEVSRVHGDIRFVARRGRASICAWMGPLGAIFADATLALGQAGTANEAAAASGLPVVALGDASDEWYRRRQRLLLGEAMTVVPNDPVAAARAVADLLADSARRVEMGRTGRERMGGPGGAAAIARAIAQA